MLLTVLQAVSDPVSKVYDKSQEENETMKRKSRSCTQLHMPKGPLIMAAKTVQGRCCRRVLGSIPQTVSLSQKTSYQSHSRLQIGPKSERSSVSSGKCSQRCSPVGGQAEQGPVGRVSSSLNTAQTSERETRPQVGEKTSPQAVCSVATQIVYVKHIYNVDQGGGPGKGFNNSSSLVQQRMIRQIFIFFFQYFFI